MISLRSKNPTAKISSKSRVLPAVFTERGLYMLATILKSKKAVNATFAICKTG
ncbi:ORF6N domain-containing protein [Paraprevotella xylaniphila]|uniref:ORF6N domain-containing protein n=1 Tax=Paraprevotella xylaniphila TaxID=454155 RepID=UPI003FD85EBD